MNDHDDPSTYSVAPLTREEISTTIDTLSRFYECAPFGWGEIGHTVNALDEYRHRMGD